MTPSRRLGVVRRRLSSAVSPLLVVAVALAGVAVVGYLRGAYGTAIAVGVGAILTSAFVVLSRR